MFKHAILLSFVALFIASCSYKKNYIANDFVRSELSKIEILEGQDIIAAEYYDSLSKLLKNNPLNIKYSIETRFSIRKNHALLLEDAEILRQRNIVEVSYILTDKSSGKVLLQENFRKNITYNISSLPYVNTVRDEDSSIKLASSVATEIYNRLILFFLNRNEALLK